MTPRMKAYLKQRETVSPVDELVVLQEPSLPGQRRLFDEPERRQPARPKADHQRKLF